MRLFIVFGLAAITLLIECSAEAQAPKQTLEDRSRSAIEKSLPYLRNFGRSWMDGKVDIQENKACVSCHYVNFSVWSHRASQPIGIGWPEIEIENLADDAMRYIDNQDKGRVVSWSHAILANTEPSQADRAQFVKWAGWITDRQKKDGYWAARGQFPTQAREVEESNAVATMWAILALQDYQDEPKVTDSVKRALVWLDQSTDGVAGDVCDADNPQRDGLRRHD